MLVLMLLLLLLLMQLRRRMNGDAILLLVGSGSGGSDGHQIADRVRSLWTPALVGGKASGTVVSLACVCVVLNPR